MENHLYSTILLCLTRLSDSNLCILRLRDFEIPDMSKIKLVGMKIYSNQDISIFRSDDYLITWYYIFQTLKIFLLFIKANLNNSNLLICLQPSNLPDTDKSDKSEITRTTRITTATTTQVMLAVKRRERPSTALGFRYHIDMI